MMKEMMGKVKMMSNDDGEGDEGYVNENVE